jgi:ribosomal protein S27E
MENRGEFLVVNRMYGVDYATPRKPINLALQNGLFPILDWPVEKISLMKEAFPGKLYTVYLFPPSLEILYSRLSNDNRDENHLRRSAAFEELEKYWSNQHDYAVDLHLSANTNQINDLAWNIYSHYLQACQSPNIESQTSPTVEMHICSNKIFSLKQDKYRKVRGGNAKFLDIYCSNCQSHLLLYQKDGPGNLLRLYLNRIFAPEALADLQHKIDGSKISNLHNLTCESCGNSIGIPMVHNDGRVAYRLRIGSFFKRVSKGMYLPM